MEQSWRHNITEEVDIVVILLYMIYIMSVSCQSGSVQMCGLCCVLGFTSILTVLSWLLLLLCISRMRTRIKSELQWSKINLLLPHSISPSSKCLLLLLVLPPSPPPPDQSPLPPPHLLHLFLPGNSNPLQQHRGRQLAFSLWISFSRKH